MTENNEMGIDNILDIHKVANDLTVGLIKIFKDGAQATDLMPLIELAMSQIEPVKELIKDIDMVDDEFRDLSEAESAQLAGAAIGTVFGIIKALK